MGGAGVQLEWSAFTARRHRSASVLATSRIHPGTAVSPALLQNIFEAWSRMILNGPEHDGKFGPGTAF